MVQTIDLESGAKLVISSVQENAKGTIVICPGGGYGWLSPREGMPIANAFKAYGWDAAILHYTCYDDEKGERLGTKPLRQLGEAVQTARTLHPGKPVIVCGFSAGGHLAASIGVHWKTLDLPRPDAMVLSYPVISSGEFAHRGSMEHLAEKEEQEFFSLEKHVGAHVPPAFIWHTAADQTVPVENSLMFAAALSSAKVPFELHVFPNGVHGLSLATPEVAEEGRKPDAHVAQWVSLCAKWLDMQHKNYIKSGR